ncbi:hypothetical protein pipiens_002345 [Culex pipiens pipiens]|uniref:Uncharacterized protein n=1 Tax=Culex pipiens pipiens TaxID=38569 RepID=A0ABD1DGX2_CULPP
MWSNSMTMIRCGCPETAAMLLVDCGDVVGESPWPDVQLRTDAITLTSPDDFDHLANQHVESSLEGQIFANHNRLVELMDWFWHDVNQIISLVIVDGLS